MSHSSIRRALLGSLSALAALALVTPVLSAAPLVLQDKKPVLKFTGIPNQNTTELAEK